MRLISAWGSAESTRFLNCTAGGFMRLLCRRTASGRAYEPPTLARAMRIKMWCDYTPDNHSTMSGIVLSVY